MMTTRDPVRTTSSDGIPSDRGPRRWGVVMIGIWLFYLLSPLTAGWEHRGSVEGWVGMAATVAFAALYLTTFVRLRNRRRLGPFQDWRNAVLMLAGAVALAVVICVGVGQPGEATAVYIAVLAVVSLPSAPGLAVAATVAVVVYLATIAVPGWDRDGGILFGTLAATVAVWGIRQMLLRTTALAAAREENARLAVEEERNRFARDLHDILGHSLTVITVKAELASRLLDVDPERAKLEVADLERLSRDALADVRRAVEGYRELTLPGELARARQALDAAEIDARLPSSADDVPSELRELFAWTVREGVTNVIRHSGAKTCTVLLERRSLTVRDDGKGVDGDSVAASGLRGLRERAAVAGAVVVTRSLDPDGFELSVVAA
jgi:two-component system, NarL family, sensor histidine kinase DesK